MEKLLKLYALTGGIGSGKSSALGFLREAGYFTLSSDRIVSELYEKRSVKKILKSLFPTAVNGFFRLTIDRKKIAQLAFNNPDLHQKLTDTITPLVLEEIKKRTQDLSGIAFVEVPLLFECGYQNEFDGVIVIARDKADRIESVKQRSNLTEQEILARMAKQIDYDGFDLTPYIVIKNDGDQETLKEKVLIVAKTL